VTDPVAQRIVFVLRRSQLAALALVAQGKSNKDIADRINRSPGTVRNNMLGIYDETGMGSRLELAMFVHAHPQLRDAANAALVEINDTHRA